MIAGSICAWIVLSGIQINTLPIIKWLALALILFISYQAFDSIHPRGDALIAVLATTVIILGQDNWLPRKRIFIYIEKIGDWSYSIYLVHWPIFVFTYILYFENTPKIVSFLLIITSIIFGYLQFIFIEKPFRHYWDIPSTYIWKKIGFATFLLLIFPLAMFNYKFATSKTGDAIDEIRKGNYGLSENCDGSFIDGKIKSTCINSSNPQLAVWGDSYAMHLVPGLSRANKNIVQLTKSVCGPMIGLAPINKKFNQKWAKGCLEHNRISFDFIKQSESITHVILSSTFGQYFGESTGQFLVENDVIEKDPVIARTYLIETINQLKESGKQVVLISPPPRSGFNIGSCLEREDRNLFGFLGGCDINLEDYLRRDRSINESLASVSDETSIKIIWLKNLLCKDGICSTRINGKYIYRDGGHLSIEGSTILLQVFNFNQ